MRAQGAAKVEEAVKRLEAAPLPAPADMFDYVYSELPARLAEQKKQVTDG